MNLVRDRIREYGISTSHFKRRQSSTKPSASSILVFRGSGRRVPAFRLRKALIESGIPYSCVGCGCQPFWNGKKLILQVDHKDGNWKDDRIENLRFLCPNCHSQTETFGAVKNRESLRTNNGGGFGEEITKCKNCKKDIIYPSSRSKRPPVYCEMDCRKAFQENQSKILWPDDDDLRMAIMDRPISIIAKELRVSDSTVLRRCRKKGIETNGSGYWTRRRSETKQAHGEI